MKYPTTLHLIFARASNGVMGRDNQLPWQLPEDLQHFKRTTANSPVIMGRKTWDSLPPQVRPLPGRLNVVVTRQPTWQCSTAVRASSLHEAIDLCGGHRVSWVIGGAQLIQEAMPLAAKMVVTEIGCDFEGDVYAPIVSAPWCCTNRQHFTAKNGLAYDIVTWHKLR